RKAFGTSFTLWDGNSGELLHASVQQPGSNDLFRGQLARAIHGNEPQFIADEDCLLLLAVPLDGPHGRPIVATASFVVRDVSQKEYLNGAATLLGLDQARAMAWIVRQQVWPPDALLRLAAAAQAQIKAEARASNLQREVEKLSDNLASTYEEICLLHSVTQNLRISSDEEQICSLVLRWLKDCLPAEAVAIQLLPVAKEGHTTYKARTQSVLYALGDCPLDNDGFTTLIETLNLEAGCGPLVANRAVTGDADWPLPKVQQLIVVPMAEGARVLGWLAVLNHTCGAEFNHIKEHPELGYRILADLHELADVLPGVLHHHEQWDGKGYPFKLAGEQIPLLARILAVADAYDAMCSDRPYRRGMPVERVE